jgi:hypothetical protein
MGTLRKDELLGITPKLKALLVHKNKTKAYYY